MITFKNVKYKNILSVGNKFIEIPLNTHSTNLIIGKTDSSDKSNGSGKSTFIEAIIFVLFGKPFRKINKPQLVNNRNRGELLVEIELNTQGKDYRIVRGIKPSVFKIYENNILLNQELDYQDIIESNILKMNYKTFTHIVIIGNVIHTPFMQLKSEERRVIVESLLDIDIFSKMNNILKQDFSDIKENINNYENQKEIISGKLDVYKKTFLSTDNNINTKIENNKIKIDILKENLKNKQDIVLKETELLLDEKKLEQYSEKQKAIFNKIEKLKEYRLLFDSKLKTIIKDTDFINKNDNCILCKQTIDSAFKESFYIEKKKEKENIEIGLQEAINKLEKFLTETENISNILKNHKQITEKISKLNIEISFLIKEINDLLKQNEEYVQEKQVDKKIIQEEFDLLNKNLIRIKETKEKYINKSHIYNLIGMMLKDEGIKTKIIKYYIPTINKLINKYLKLLDFNIFFQLQDNFSEIIVSPNKSSFSYDSFSEGEKVRIDLAIMFTWREIAKIKNSGKTNLLILDEIFDSSLDSVGIENFMKTIDSIKKETNIFVISHKEEILTEKFENIIKFEKKSGGFTKRVI